MGAVPPGVGPHGASIPHTTVPGRYPRDGRPGGRVPGRRIGGPGHPSRAGPLLAAGLPGALALLVSWPCAVAAALLGATGCTLVRRSLLRARQQRELAAAALTLDALGRELDAGAGPDAALRTVAG
jgi:hypothetical protein